MSHVLWALQDVADRHAIPGIRLAHVGVGSLHAGVVGRIVVGGALHLVSFEDAYGNFYVYEFYESGNDWAGIVAVER